MTTTTYFLIIALSVLLSVTVGVLRHQTRKLHRASEETSRLRRQARKQAEQLALIGQISQEISGVLDENTLLRRVVELTRERFGYEFVEIFLTDAQGDTLTLKAAAGRTGPLEGRFQMRLGEGIVGWVAEAGQALLVNDLSQEPRHVAAPWPTASELAVPLKLREATIGVLNVENVEKNTFDESDLATLQALADQVAMAIEATRALHDAQRQAEEIYGLYNVSMAASSTLDLEQMLQAMYEQVAQLLNISTFYIALWDEERAELDFKVFVDKGQYLEPFTRRLTNGGGLTGWIVENRQPLLFQDMEKEQDRLPVSTITLGDPTRSWLGLPLLARDKLVGVISIQSYEPNIFTEEHQRVLQAIANQAAVTIENARLYQAAQRWARQLQAMAEVSQKAASILDPESLLASAVELIRAHFDYYHVHVFLLDPSARALVFGAGSGRAGKVIEEEGLRLPLGGPGIIVAAAESAQPVLSNDVSQEPRYVFHPALPDTKSELAVPLQLGQEVIGVLDVQSDRLNAFDKQDVAALETLGRQIAIAVKNARLYSEVSLAAATDALTTLWNRRTVEKRLEGELSRAGRFGQPLSLLLIDVDNFKLFNDTYGHPTGDTVLKMIANTLKSCCRDMDVVGRYGGDEFAIILPETTVQDAVHTVQRITSVMRGQSFVTVENVRLPLGLSIGVAGYPTDASEMNELLFLSDSALYEAKHSGGNAYRLASSIRARGVTAEEATFDALRGLVIAVDNKDRYTQQHSQEVARYSVLLAQRMGLPDTFVRNLEIAGLLHDVGKIGIPDRILRKPGALSPGEREVVQGHSSLGHMILKQLPHLTEVLKAVLHHHERYDGQGYPSGLKGEEIPYLARVLAVADAYSAMTSDRPYRRALTRDEAIVEIRANAGGQFDPEIAAAFIQHCVLSDEDER